MPIQPPHKVPSQESQNPHPHPICQNPIMQNEPNSPPGDSPIPRNKPNLPPYNFPQPPVYAKQTQFYPTASFAPPPFPRNEPNLRPAITRNTCPAVAQRRRKPNLGAISAKRTQFPTTIYILQSTIYNPLAQSRLTRSEEASPETLSSARAPFRSVRCTDR